MSFSDVLGAIWRRKLVVLTCALLGALAVVLVGRPDGVLSTRYSASTSMVVGGQNDRSKVVLYEYVATETDAISEQVAQELGAEWNVDRLFRVVDISVEPDIGSVAISVEDVASEEAAIGIVQSYADQLIAFATTERTLEHEAQIEELVRRRISLRSEATVQQSQLEAARPVPVEGEPEPDFEDNPILRTQLVASLSSLSTVLSDLEALEAISPEELVPLAVVGPPTLSSSLVGGETLGFAGRMAVAIGLGLLLGSVLVVASAAFDTTIYSRRDVAGTTAPMLAEIPVLPRSHRKVPSIITADKPKSPHAEGFRFLRTQLSRPLQRVERETGYGWVLVVASSNVAVGKSTVTANLAHSFTQVGKSVLVISADLRRPTIDQYFEVRSGRGLTELLAEDSSSSVLRKASGMTQNPGVTVLRHGPKTEVPGETLRLLGPTVKAARQVYDVILIDSAPMVIGNDFGEIATFADHALLVARAGHSGVEDLLWAEATCDEFEVPVAGVVLVAAPTDRAQRASQRRYSDRRFLGRQVDQSVGIRASDFVDPALESDEPEPVRRRTKQRAQDAPQRRRPAQSRRAVAIDDDGGEAHEARRSYFSDERVESDVDDGFDDDGFDDDVVGVDDEFDDDVVGVDDEFDDDDVVDLDDGFDDDDVVDLDDGFDDDLVDLDDDPELVTPDVDDDTIVIDDKEEVRAVSSSSGSSRQRNANRTERSSKSKSRDGRNGDEPRSPDTPDRVTRKPRRGRSANQDSPRPRMGPKKAVAKSPTSISASKADVAKSTTAKSGSAASSTSKSSTAKSGSAASSTAKSGTAASSTAKSSTAKSSTAKSGTAASSTANSGAARSSTSKSTSARTEHGATSKRTSSAQSRRQQTK